MASFLAIIFYILIAVIFYYLYQKYREHKIFRDKIDKIPGPPAILLFGNTHQFKLDRVAFAHQLGDILTQYAPHGIFRLWFGQYPIVILCRGDTAEVVLNSNKLIEKSIQYQFLKNWIGDGLLISGGDKWRSRRKMLTPAFHFSILNSFVEVYTKQSDVLVKQLQSKAVENLIFNIFPYIGRCALDIICETAMGISLNAQLNHKSDYVQSVIRISEIIFKYERMPWLRVKPIFRLMYGKEYDQCMKILREFIEKVINDRIQERTSTDVAKQIDRKKRPAFLDLLLDMQNEHKLLYEDIREEVDTFMFEGHDTTSAGMGWAVFLLGHHPEVQKKLFEELDTIFGDNDREATVEDIKQMKYLECIVKETLRLYPPVPMFGRLATESFTAGGYEIPAGAMITVIPMAIHRDPKTFGPDSHQFRPERFEDDSLVGRNPYAYVPFSAGARNCIGQKFALMEEKVVLSSIFRRFQVKSMDPIDTMVGIPDLILRPPRGFNVRLTTRR